MIQHPTLASRRLGAAVAVVGVGCLTAVLAPINQHGGLMNAGLLFLLLTLLVSAGWGWQVGAGCALASNLVLNFFFIEPHHTFTVNRPENVVGLVVFLIVSVVGGSLLSAARASSAQARLREGETQVLLNLSRNMAMQTEPAAALYALCREVVDGFAAPGASVLSPSDGAWVVLAHAGSDDAARPASGEERAMFERAVRAEAVVGVGDAGIAPERRVRVVDRRVAGITPAPRAIAFAPLRAGDRTLGILRLDGPIGIEFSRERAARLLAAFTGEAAMALERLDLAQAASEAAMLRQADEFKSALMTSISHDLKTPLAGIKAAASSLLDVSVAWSDEDRRAFLETIDGQADRLDRVLSDILDLNRIESGVVAPNRRPVLVADLLEEARERTEHATAGRPVETTTTEDLYVDTDESLVTQALVNLVENAAKYSVAGGGIRLTASKVDAHIEINVEDDGPGIAPRDLPHVFERFYRAGGPPARARGMGLGLAIVKAFVTLCGGTVRVESSGGMTRFVVALPAVPAQ